MRVTPDMYDEMPEELSDALEDADFSHERKHSRWEYAQVFVRQNADDASRSLTRRDVQADLEQETKLDTQKSTAHNALEDLVDAGILNCDTGLITYQYWLSYSLESSSATTTEGNMVDTEPVADSDTAGPISPDTDRAAGSTRPYFVSKPVWLGTLVVGLLLTFLTLVLLRLSVSTTFSIGSAALAWGILSLGLILFVVFVVDFGYSKLTRLLPN